jgi:hypothetical protein
LILKENILIMIDYNWSWWSDDPRKSPLFDGSDTSISDGGAYVGGRNYTCLPSEAAGCPIKLQPGYGGGCVSGPLANWTVTLGPIQTKAKGIKPNPQADGLGYNPRCLSRDLNKHAAYYSRDEVITELIKNSKDVLSFQNRMQGDFPSGYLGVHSAGHYTIGGDAGSDFFNSPSDPVSAIATMLGICDIPKNLLTSPLGVLLPPRNDRPDFLDLAKPRPKATEEGGRWYHYLFELATESQRYFGGYTDLGPDVPGHFSQHHPR